MSWSGASRICSFGPVADRATRRWSAIGVSSIKPPHGADLDGSSPRSHHLGELFPRVGFIVTTLTGTNRAVVRFYNQRGTAEQWIKEGQKATHWTRLSCHRFRANEVRLLLGGIAYNLGNMLRRLVLPLAIQSWSLASLQQRLFKTGGRLVPHARYFLLPLGEGDIEQRLFLPIVGGLQRPAWGPNQLI